jgi:hypothetical protein
VERDLEELKALAEQETESLDVPFVEERRGLFLGQFLNDAVRDFSLEPVRGLMDARFDRAAPGLRGPLEEMARLAGFFREEAPEGFRGVVIRAATDLPVLAMGLLGHPSGILRDELLGAQGVPAFAEAVVDGRVSRLMAAEDEFGESDRGFREPRPPVGIAMMQRALEAEERRNNPGRSVSPNGAPGGPPGGGF